jgi:hypothetical protein
MVRSLGDRGWIDEWVEPASIRVRRPPQLREESVVALREKFVIQPWRLEVDLYGMSAIRERGDRRPYLGYHLLIVESTRGFIIGGDLLVADPSFEEMWVQVPGRFVGTMTRLRSLPSEIVVRSEKLLYYLEPMAEQLGIKISLSGRLPALDRIRREFERRM